MPICPHSTYPLNSLPAFLSPCSLPCSIPPHKRRLSKYKRPPCVHRRARVVLSVQTSPVSGDSDGDLSEVPPPQKSYSVPVTIVSGFETCLRRNVIKKMASHSPFERVVVVTTGGLPFTDEHESTSDDSANDSTPSVNGFAASDPSDRPGNLEGWISCSSPQEQAQVIAKLAFSREYDCIIAEGSTDSSIEPQEFAQLLHNVGGASLRVDSLISVLDGETLLQDLSAHPPVTTTTKEQSDLPKDDPVTSAAMQNTADNRPMVLVSLVENANFILVSQSNELKESDPMPEVTNLLTLLNASASILPTSDDTVPVGNLVNTNAYDLDSVLLGATWKKVLLASRPTVKGVNRPAISKSLKDATFIYRAKRPFHPVRLYQHIKAVATFHGVIRSTGRIWLATRMLAPLIWNQAGVAATLSVGKLFWAAVPEADWPQQEEERDRIMQDWDTQYGDRETEIVFVGLGVDKERLQGLLDGCLLQDEEMVFTKMWENFEDPFVEWVPLIEDDDDEQEVIDDDAESEQDSAGDAIASTVEDDQSVLGDYVNSENDAASGEAVLSSTERLTEEGTEGQIDSMLFSDESYNRISALELFDQEFSESGLVPQVPDDGSFDNEDVVISSWDGSVADGILRQIPKKGLPVTLLTGFLGSGKTTLLNYIITAQHGLRIAVLVNEFGEIDIDNQLVEKGKWSSDDEVMELANGCICCNINDSFVQAVKKILERDPRPDYLVIETSGVADPTPVINSLMMSDIAEDLQVDGILTLIDTENFDPETHMDSDAALSQILAADTILLSKTDIAPPQKIEETIKYIKSIRPAARILRSQRGKVPINLILDVGVRVANSPAQFHPFRTGEKEGNLTHEEGQPHQDCSEDFEHNHAHSHGHNHEHNHIHDQEDHECTSHNHSQSNHLEEDGFLTTSFKADAPLDAQLFMDEFLQKLPEGVFRAKGLLRFYGYRTRYVFQLSGRRYQIDEDEWPEGVAPGNQMVIIGRDLDIDSLRRTLESCIVEERDA